jgi:hypothetical protein
VLRQRSGRACGADHEPDLRRTISKRKREWPSRVGSASLEHLETNFGPIASFPRLQLVQQSDNKQVISYLKQNRMDPLIYLQCSPRIEFTIRKSVISADEQKAKEIIFNLKNVI